MRVERIGGYDAGFRAVVVAQLGLAASAGAAGVQVYVEFEFHLLRDHLAGALARVGRAFEAGGVGIAVVVEAAAAYVCGNACEIVCGADLSFDAVLETQ